MTIEEQAQIIATGDVPLSLRMDPRGRGDQSGVQMALEAHSSGRYDGMTYDQVLARLKRNRAAAESN
jgi:hypothetical protein